MRTMVCFIKIIIDIIEESIEIKNNVVIYFRHFLLLNRNRINIYNFTTSI